MSGEYYPDRVRGEEGKGVSACGRVGAHLEDQTRSVMHTDRTYRTDRTNRTRVTQVDADTPTRPHADTPTRLSLAVDSLRQ
jgi:hypothetical protein